MLYECEINSKCITMVTARKSPSDVVNLWYSTNVLPWLPQGNLLVMC